MNVRKAALMTLGAITLLTLASCGGGGGAMSVLSVIPKGDYYMLSGSNLAAKYETPFYKNLADEVKRIEDEEEDWEDRLDDMEIDNVRSNNLVLSLISEDAVENVMFHAGRFNYDDLEDYFEDEQGWQDWDEDEKNNIVYYTGKLGASEYAALIERGGLFSGRADAIEDIIEVITEGDKRLLDDKDFNEHSGLVDFSATEFSLQWDNIDGTIANYKNQISQIDDDEDLQEAFEDLEAEGVSIYWGNSLRVVIKWQFGKDKHLDALAEFLMEEMDEVLDKLGPGIVMGVFGADADTDDIEDLADRITVTRRGKIIEIVAEFRWEDFEDMVD